MLNQWTGIITLSALFLLIIGSLFLGRKIAQKQAKETKIKTSALAQGTIFALLGLLVAFTFSGALTKFDMRRQLIIEEANDIGTAYLRIDLLPSAYQASLKSDFKEYLTSRINTYKALPNVSAAQSYYETSLRLQNKIWGEATEACSKADSTYPCMLVIPALNSMFDIANTRIQSTQIHPPLYIFILLLGIVFVGSLLAGYKVYNQKWSQSLDTISYAVILALVIISIIDLEYPRLGFIRVDKFDQVLVDLQNSMVP